MNKITDRANEQYVIAAFRSDIRKGELRKIKGSQKVDRSADVLTIALALAMVVIFVLIACTVIW